MSKKQKLDNQEEPQSTRPFKIVFDNGHLAVWQCFNHNHALDRAKETYPNKIVRSISEVK
jgi:hypothetical protein